MSELSQVMAKLDSIDDKQDDALEHLQTLAAGMAAQDHRIAKLEKVIDGNGTPGLKSDVQAIKIRCDTRHAENPWSSVLRGVIQTVLAAMVLAALAFAMGLWKTH